MKEKDIEYKIYFPHYPVQNKEELFMILSKYKQRTLRVKPFDSNNPLHKLYNLIDRSDPQMLCFCSPVVDQLMTQALRIDLEAGRPQWHVQMDNICG